MARTLKTVTAEAGTPTGALPAKNNLATAISNISAACEQVTKGGYNKHFSYNFATAPDVIRAVKELMHQHHVIITQDETDCEMLTPEVLKCTYAFTVEHTISGENKIIKSSGMAKVSGDKRGFNDRACQAIATTTYKYMLIRLFNLVVDGVPDVDDQGDGKPKTLNKQQAAGTFKRLTDEVAVIANLGDLQEWGEHNGVLIATLPDEWQKILRYRYTEKLHEFKPEKTLTVVAAPKTALQPLKQQGAISQRAINNRAQRLRQARDEGANQPPFDENPY